MKNGIRERMEDAIKSKLNYKQINWYKLNKNINFGVNKEDGGACAPFGYLILMIIYFGYYMLRDMVPNGHCIKFPFKSFVSWFEGRFNEINMFKVKDEDGNMDRELYLFKIKGPGMNYEIVLGLYSGWICSIHGGKARELPDLALALMRGGTVE